ncbi:hypothetical protein [Lichenicola sp.]|uniref:hypothetical protein n=1 Tax=Lichenicola sp. TaxID=2804529 RepID=UPI003B00E65D
MKSILSASVCAATLLLALPALAATDDAKPMHHHHMGKHMGKHTGMHGKAGYGKAKDATTESLNDRSLAAARGGSAPSTGSDSSTTAPGTGSSMAPMSAPGGTSTMTPPASGSTGTMAPTNAPGG